MIEEHYRRECLSYIYGNVMKTQQSSPLQLRCCGLSCGCNIPFNCLLPKAIYLHKNNNTCTKFM